MHMFGMITDQEAQRIASEWHGGGGSPLYQFASTGAILNVKEMADEITECARQCKGLGGRDFTNLIELRTYCRRHGPRGPVTDWYQSTIAKG